MDLWNAHFKVNDGVVWRVLGNDCLLLHLSTGVYYTLNEVGRFLWESFDGKRTLAELHREILDRYEVDEEAVKQDILEIMEDLIKEDLVKYDEKPPGDRSVS
jgi:hypothetical protein